MVCGKKKMIYCILSKCFLLNRFFSAGPSLYSHCSECKARIRQEESKRPHQYSASTSNDDASMGSERHLCVGEGRGQRARWAEDEVNRRFFRLLNVAGKNRQMLTPLASEDLNPERRLAVSDHTVARRHAGSACSVCEVKVREIAVCQRLQTNTSRTRLIDQQCLFLF